ncbi:MAG: hypothetical protein M0036_24590 [Desulfobacteraceae bacterium]|nr:hypothetical protein [Desulfobacteraceae bacterium]
MKALGRAIFLVIRISCVFFLLTACSGGGGGGGSDEPQPTPAPAAPAATPTPAPTATPTPAPTATPTPTPTPHNATITGAVAGATAVAYNEDSGAEVARNAASGTPKTFTFTIPTGASYKIYVIENAGADQRIYPLYACNTNVFAFDGSSDFSIDLGYVNTVSGIAVPTNSLCVAGVTPGNEDPTVPADLAASSLSSTNLAGTWYFNGLMVGSKSNGTSPFWFRGTTTIAPDGSAARSTFYSFGYSTPIQDSYEITDIWPSGVILPAFNLGRRMLTLNGQMTIGVDTDATPGDSAYYLLISQRAGAAGSYATADLEGVWRFQGLYVLQGAIPAGWSYGAYNIVADGSSAGGEFTTSGGTMTQGPFTFSIDPDTGVVSSGTTSFQGVMTQDKKMIVATLTTNTVINSTTYSIYNLIIYQKVSASFTSADLQGVWNFHELIAGGNGTTEPRAWAYGHLTINGDEFTQTDVIADNFVPPADTTYHAVITADGVVTLTDAPAPFPFHALMSDDKRMMISVSMNGNGEGYRLTVYQR